MVGIVGGYKRSLWSGREVLNIYRRCEGSKMELLNKSERSRRE